MSLNLEVIEESALSNVENIVLISQITSTHDMALALVEQAAEDEIELPPTLIVAESQWAGHGRSGRPWISPRGGLYLSVVRCGLPERRLRILPMAAAVAAARAVAATGAEVGIKWPNDLVASGGKMGGLLLHTRRGNASLSIISFGLNVQAIPGITGAAGSTATSLAEHLDGASAPPDCGVLATSFLAQLSRALEHAEETMAQWRGLLIHREGDTLKVHLENGTTVSGTFAGISEEGRLRLQTAGGERVLSTGEVGLG